jgi:hypothetical protein
LEAKFRKIKSDIDFNQNIKKIINDAVFLAAQINVKEIKSGLTGLYDQPKHTFATQGKGLKQFGKGIGYGAIRLTTSPITAVLRSTYALSTGIKNSASGIKDHG